MSEDAREREAIVRFARSLHERGLTGGSSGNISVRRTDGTLLVTPTGSSFGALDPARLAHVGTDGALLSGDAPTKEYALHAAFYETRAAAGAVVHLHSTHSVAWSMITERDPDDVLPPITPYAIMQLGRVKLLPIYLPGDPAMGDAVRGLAGRHSAVLLANHGPVVSARSLEAAVYATEELEETAKLAVLVEGRSPRTLSDEHVRVLMERREEAERSHAR